MKNKLSYNLIRYSTLILPIITFILLSATFLNVKYAYEIKGKLDDIVMSDDFIYTTDKNASYIGKIEFNEELGTYGIYVKEGDIIKVGFKFISYEELEFNELSATQVQKKESWKLGLGIVSTIVGVVIVILLSLGKLKIKDKYKELALLISLGAGTGVLYLINIIVSSIFWVFLIAFVSYGAYLGEEQIYLMLNKEVKAEKKKSRTLEALTEIANRL